MPQAYPKHHALERINAVTKLRAFPLEVMFLL